MGGGTGANPRGPPGTPSRYGQGLRGCDLSQEIRPRRKTRGGGSEKLLARRRQQVKPRRLPAGVNSQAPSPGPTRPHGTAPAGEPVDPPGGGAHAPGTCQKRATCGRVGAEPGAVVSSHLTGGPRHSAGLRCGHSAGVQVHRPDGETETQREQQSPEPPRRSHPLPIPVPIPLPSTAQGPPPKVLPGAGPHPAASRDKVECPLWTKGNKTFF
ncbi:CASP-like protein 4A2 isoform X2 [Canis lupus familiaris]|uniref:CASP-like protein 4A2 isoform X2 n=1 Tax=Canis lupus familiaris TaxID=9615 RepID=UPI000BAA0442|nr:CASP-like protein 4A2 isoform X2 [Canis lupus familiaris]|eukprot:XP_022279928.1 CASP-like protein 4A2 isoform X2 [Canis lupus familiaris]